MRFRRAHSSVDRARSGPPKCRGERRRASHRGCVPLRCRGRTAHRQSAPDGNATTAPQRTGVSCADEQRTRAARPAPGQTPRCRCDRRSREMQHCAKQCSGNLLAGDADRRALVAIDRRSSVRRAHCAVPLMRTVVAGANRESAAHRRPPRADSARAAGGMHPGAEWSGQLSRSSSSESFRAALSQLLVKRALLNRSSAAPNLCAWRCDPSCRS